MRQFILVIMFVGMFFLYTVENVQALEDSQTSEATIRFYFDSEQAPGGNGNLPQTGSDSSSLYLIGSGMILLATIGSYIVYKKRDRKEFNQ
ncbi:LPXTG cell wall anchor domain-containing protein [Enterococcus mundtii]|uniref:Gram-positive cocci surface proteins LPxTG domain-containing protein n=1 Tax=Enterococcus mundtii TaxID=53346 RepID=A0A242KUN5_ENTMU|nr:LPXTG cell wall anchor domain-containing protein [Enterococcus mundtii]OTP24859.1 hypothetical protein A5802_003014 [Enterococcus mundtii]